MLCPGFDYSVKLQDLTYSRHIGNMTYGTTADRMHIVKVRNWVGPQRSQGPRRGSLAQPALRYTTCRFSEQSIDALRQWSESR